MCSWTVTKYLLALSNFVFILKCLNKNKTCIWFCEKQVDKNNKQEGLFELLIYLFSSFAFCRNKFTEVDNVSQGFVDILFA